MATRMQQRRGTAAQWTAANPTLAAGEIGFETDTSKFKMGTGSNAWNTLAYFANNTALETLLAGDYPATLDTLNEIAAALGDDPTFFTTVATNLSTHAADTTSVHGITDTSLLATTTHVATNLGTHNSATVGVHGIADTAGLATTSATASAISTAVTNHQADTTQVHGIADTADLVTTSEMADAISSAAVDQAALAGAHIDWNAGTSQYDIASTVALAATVASDIATAISTQAGITTSEIGTHSADTTNVHGIANTASIAMLADITTHSNDTTDIHGIANTALLATLADVAAVTKTTLGLGSVDNTADSAKPVSTAQATAIALAVSNHDSDTSNVHGIADTSLLATTADVAAVTKTSLGLGNVDNTADTAKPVSTAQSTAIATAKAEAIADATSQVNALLTGAPAALNTLDELAAALGDDANFAATVTTSLGLKVDSLTPISQKTASYTLSSLTERDDLIEMGSATAVTLSIPTDATLNYPIGTSIDILQTGAGQVTIAAVTPGTTTVNATPGLKLRTTWSSCTLFKRAANTWVVYGDLTA